MNYYSNNKEANILHQALIELYLSFKLKLSTDLSIESEENTLMKTNPFTVINYIKNTVDILINLQIEEAMQKSKQEEIGSAREDSLEKLTQTLETEIRSHIRVNL